MKINDIKEIAGLDDISIHLAVRQESKDGKTVYVSDATITTRDWEKSHLENVSLRDVLFNLGKAVLSAEDMAIVDKYIYEYNKIDIARRGGLADLLAPGYLSYIIPRKAPDAKDEFQLHFSNGYSRYHTLEELYRDAKTSAVNKTLANAVRSLMF